MKKVLFSLSLLASLATFAGESTLEATAQVFGVLPITTSNQSVIVSVPWAAAGCTENPIAVSNLIKTANLTLGDTLRVYVTNTKQFACWQLAESGGVRYWNPVATVSGDKVVPANDAGKVYLERGEALILTRNGDSSESGKWVSGQDYTFYVYGQVSSSTTPVTITVAQGTAETPAYTLIAPPYATEADINDDATWTGLSKGGVLSDVILYGDGNANVGSGYYAKNIEDVGWRWGDRTSGWHDAPKLKAGVGCWYVSHGSNTNVKVTWTNK